MLDEILVTTAWLGSHEDQSSREPQAPALQRHVYATLSAMPTNGTMEFSDNTAKRIEQSDMIM